MISKFYLSEEIAEVEFCYYIVSTSLSNKSQKKLESILSRNGRYVISSKSRVMNSLEIGPQTNFKTAWCQNMLDILHRVGLTEIERIEHSIRYPNRKVPPYDKMLFRLYYSGYFETSLKNQIGQNTNESMVDNIEYVSVKDYNRKMGLNLSYEDEKRYEDMFQKLGRQATNVEVYDLSQSQSEHARHWFFKGEINKENLSLFDKIKSCYQPEKHKNSMISFYDNASVIEGGMCNHLYINHGRKYEEAVKKINFSYKAETHNFPTGISPFPGAATGSGGRIRDLLCVGKGGQIIAGTAGYCVGDIPLVNLSLDISKDYKWLPSSPQRILIEASNGASDYGNKIGEPLIQGFTRSYRQDFSKLNNSGGHHKTKRIEWLKPIMFSGGIGIVHDRDIKKEDARDKLLIVRVGGPAYRIGMGGGSASSRTQSTVNQRDDFQAVQRGDPLMANKLCRFLRCLVNRRVNPIVSIHDQGSGGMANVTREIAEGSGATIYLDRVFSGDSTLTSLEKWVAEYQEQITLLVEKRDFKILKVIGKRENISVVEVGEINNSKHLQVWNKSPTIGDTTEIDNLNRKKAVDIPMEIPEVRKKYHVKRVHKDYDILDYAKVNLTTQDKTYLINKIERILSLVDVGSKQFLTNKVDRSVGGLVVQQQCIGPFHLPLSNLSAVKASFDSSSTLVSAIGEKPIIGVSNSIEDMVNLTVGEMLTNIMWCQIGSLSNINSVANWMWPSINESDGAELRDAVNQLTKLSHILEFSINGGKDSLSMKVRHEEEEISAPSTLTLSGYATIHNHLNIISPHLKSGESKILLVRLDKFRGGMLGSAYSRFYNVSNRKTQWLNVESFPKIWKVMQGLIHQNIILSGHDISDGGLITTLVEMAFSSYYGLDLDIQSKFLVEEFLFSEELGFVIEVGKNKLEFVLDAFNKEDIEVMVLGCTSEEKEVFIKYNGHIVLAEKNKDLRWLWQKTSYLLEREQANPECIEDEIKNCYEMGIFSNKYPDTVTPNLSFNDYMYHKFDLEKPKVAIMRADGSNGEMEMGYAFLQVGFEPEDVNIYDAMSPNFDFQKFKGIVWVGGFTYGDVLGAAEGWCQVLELKKKELDDFYQRDDTFSLGVCNGCQLMTRLGWVEGVQMEKNNSGRFESRWSRVKIIDDNNIFFKGLKDVSLGIYSAHGEGKMVNVRDNVVNNVGNIISYPVRYVDRENQITRKYPFNPNGSPEGRAAALSSNGRHLAIMPHPERTIMNWQVPHQHGYNYTPWFIMFKNLYHWCQGEDILDEVN